jgi:antitoxin YefM
VQGIGVGSGGTALRRAWGLVSSIDHEVRSMATISVTDARTKLPELVEDVASHLSEYVITKHGRAHAVLLSAEEHESLLETLEILSDSATMERIRTGLEELARGDVVSFEEVFGEPL